MKLSDKVKNVIGTIAPTLGTVLGGPLGGLAGTVLKNVLGTDDPKAIEDAILSGNPDVLLKVKQADADLKVKLKELDIREDEIAAGDRASARELAKINSRPQELLSLVIMGIYLAVLAYLLYTRLYPEAVTFMLGALFREIPTVMQFWFGSSSGSKAKSDELASLLKDRPL